MAYTGPIPRWAFRSPLFAPALWWISSVLYFYRERPRLRGESFRVSLASSFRFATSCRRSWRYLSSAADDVPAPAWGGTMADCD